MDTSPSKLKMKSALHVYIYVPFTCGLKSKADFIFNLDGLEVELPRKVGLLGECDIVR